MKNKAKLFLAYFPVIFLGCQMAANVLYFVAPEIYITKGLLLNALFGGSLLFAIFLVCFTFIFRFCEVSRWAAIAELIFGIMALFMKDDVYNISLQLGIGLFAMIATFRHYIKKFPLCTMSLFFSFIGSVFSAKGNCEKAIDLFSTKLTDTVAKNHDFK